MEKNKPGGKTEAICLKSEVKLEKTIEELND